MSRYTTSTLLLLAATLPVQADEETRKMEVIEVQGKSLKPADLSLQTENTAANRLGMTILETPASIEIIDQESIAEKGDYSSLSAITRATGFSSSAGPGNGGTAVSARGFSGHSSVAYTYDGSRLYIGAGTVSFPADTWTFERVEVLRGPGSVINGIGAIGATVNYIPKKPSLASPQSEIDLTLGSDNLTRIAFGSGGALTDKLGYRLDLVSHQTDGYVDRADEERNVVAGALLYQPNDRFSATLSIDYANTDAAPYWGTPLVDGSVPDAIRRNNYNIEDGLVEYQDTWPRLHLEWQLSDIAVLRNDTYYMEVERHWRNVESYEYNSTTGLVDRASYLEILHEQEQLGNRTDVLFDFDINGMRNRVSVGAEVNRIDFSHINNSPYGGASSVDLLNPVPGTWAEGVVDETTADYDTDTTQCAVFIDNSLEINDQWSFVTGVRYDDIDYHRHDLARSNGQPADDIDTTLDGTSYRLGGVYKPLPQVSLYAQYSKAVDGIQSILSATDPTLKLSDGEQLEVGVKHEPLSGRLQYTIALYDITKNNLLSRDAFDVQRQIGEQSSRGVEIDLFWMPMDSLTVDLNLALLDPKFETFVNDGEDLSGNMPRNVPDKTANLWVTWQATSDWSVGGGARYVAERYLDNENTETLPEYVVWDAVIYWQLQPDLLISLRGKNLTDTDDYVLSSYSGQWILGDGRSAEIGLNYRF